MLHDYTSTTAGSVTADVDAAIRRAGELIDGLVAAAERTHATTLAPLDAVGTVLADAYGRSGFMGRVHPDAGVRDAGTAAEERLAKYASDLVFRDDLYRAVKEFADSAAGTELDGTRKRLLEFWLRDFRRAGHELPADQREELQRLHTRLIEVQVAFERNLVEWDDCLELTREQLAGLPDDYIAALSPGEAEGTHRVSMEYPEYIPFMQQARDRDLRRRLQHKFWNRATEANRPLLAEALDLRDQMAELLGYPSWAHHAMELKMARHPDAVAEMYDGITPGLEKRRDEELDVMRRLAAADGADDGLQAWDWTYYDNEQRRRDYGVDQNEVAAYFPLERVVDGMFAITGEVFGLEYRRVDEAHTWHPDVALYEIRNAGSDEPIAYFYADLFPRDGKYGHAAAFGLVYGKTEADGTYRKPVAAIVANFTKPTAGAPSLLKHSETVTLFHEFGHILHFCLTTVDLLRFSGYDSEWDFVEAPSQIMEHWTWQPEVLQRFARHYETDEPIPTDLVERLIAARDLNQGITNMRQVFLGKMDLAFHERGRGKNLSAIYRTAYEHTGLPFHEDTFFPASFGHLLGGYDAGYYGYLWAKVYGDDMFSVFEDEGITSPDVGRRYRDEVLARGGSRDAIEHLRAFLGREPSTEAFLRHLGIGT